MIRYIQEKKIDYSLFKEILSDSSATNQFTNNGPAKLELEKKIKHVLGTSRLTIIIKMDQ